MKARLAVNPSEPGETITLHRDADHELTFQEIDLDDHEAAIIVCGTARDLPERVRIIIEAFNGTPRDTSQSAGVQAAEHDARTTTASLPIETGAAVIIAAAIHDLTDMLDRRLSALQGDGR